MYNPAVIANYFLNKASSEGRALTPMQIIKMVYIAHGWHLGYGLGPLFDETVQAWKYGPVIKSLYDKMKGYGSQAVLNLLPTGFLKYDFQIDDADTRALLDSVWNSYSSYSGIELSNMTHQEGTPWYKAWIHDGGRSMYFAEIDDKEIASYYRGLVESLG